MLKQYQNKNLIVLIAAIMVFSSSSFAQKPMRAGTTAANFLEIGYGAGGNSMGDAYVSLANDVSAIYWNPAGLARMSRSEVMFVTQPWIVDMQTSFGAFGIVIPGFGTIGSSIILMDYGEMDVTTMDQPEGTGERFTAKDIAMGISFARNLSEWFSFGASGKLVTSTIWHETATAIAFDLGVIIKTEFFSPTGNNEQGINIGMSISNYGTSLRYDGLDLLNPIDADPNAAGNYRDAPGRYATQDWELPLIFRIGTSVTPIYTESHELVLSADALHPNNNTESVNVGAQYAVRFPVFGKVFVRAGYKGLLMEDSQFSESYGAGVQLDQMFNQGLKIEYAFRNIGVLGDAQSFSVSILF